MHISLGSIFGKRKYSANSEIETKTKIMNEEEKTIMKALCLVHGCPAMSRSNCKDCLILIARTKNIWKSIN